MKTPLKLSVKQIARVIEKHFGTVIDSLEFIPEGEVSWIYKAREVGTSRFWIIKIQTKHPPKAANATLELLVEAGYKWMPTQLLTKKGKIWVKHRRRYYSLQQYLDPGIGSDVFQLDDVYLPELGEALRDLHSIKVSDNVRAALPSVRDHELRWEKDLDRFLKRMKKSRLKKNRVLKELVIANEASIRSLLSKQTESYRSLQKLPEVLVHADIHPYNVLRPSGDHLYIVDWDIMRIAHREEDLMYFNDRQLKLISKGYGADLLKNRAAIDYYRRHLTIRALVHFGSYLALKSKDATIRKYGLGGLKDTIQALVDNKP